jgi:ankyrin repeat protein
MMLLFGNTRHVEAARLLVKNDGANMLAREAAGDTPLHHAAADWKQYIMMTRNKHAHAD